MEKLARNKPLFITLSSLSVACLIGSFANPLQKLEVWKQNEMGAFGLEYQRHFILTENDTRHPYGFNPEIATKVIQIYNDYKIEKIGLLIAGFTGALTALNLGNETCIGDEIDVEVEHIKTEGKKQLILEAIKHRLAMASKSQRLLFMDEMKALINEFGSIEGEIIESDEVNATDKFTNAGYLLSEGHSVDVVVSKTWGYKIGTSEHTEMKRKFLAWQSNDDSDAEVTSQMTVENDRAEFRAVFPESMDVSTWKLTCKALGDGLSRAEIVRDVLGCSGSQIAVGNAYFAHLKKSFLDG